MPANLTKQIQKGFTMIEVIVAVFVLFIIIAFIFNIFPSVHKGLSLSENAIFAAMVSDSVMDTLRSNSFSNIVNSENNKFNVSGKKDGRTFSVDFTFDISVQEIPPYSKSVQVLVKWVEPSGQKERVIESIITN